jgi:uncharacterized protein with PIN domain
MTKRKMATRIAIALYPKEFRVDSLVIQGEIETQMKFSKRELEVILVLAEKVEEQRHMTQLVDDAKFMDEEEIEVGTCRCPDCYEGAVAIEENNGPEIYYVSNCCFARVDSDFISFNS